MSKIICTVLFYYSLLLYQPCWGYYSYNSSERTNARLYLLMRELVEDVDAKVTAVQYIRRMYDKTTAFQMGELAYGVRIKMRKMMDMYEIANDYSLTPINRTFYLIEVQRLSMHSERMLRMMESHEYERQPLSTRSEYLKHTSRLGNKTVEDTQRRIRELRQQHMNNLARSGQKRGRQPALNKDQLVENGFDTDANQ